MLAQGETNLLSNAGSKVGVGLGGETFAGLGTGGCQQQAEYLRTLQSEKREAVVLIIRHHLILNIDGFHGVWLSVLIINFQRGTGGVCVQNAGNHQSLTIGNEYSKPSIKEKGQVSRIELLQLQLCCCLFTA